MCDGYSKLVKAVVTRNQTAETVVKIVLKEWIFVYGTPEKIHSDQGRKFTSKIGYVIFLILRKAKLPHTIQWVMDRLKEQIEQNKGY